jgi:hypothetical protein
VVDIVVEAETVAPAGYAGRREPTTTSPLRLTALLPGVPLTEQAEYTYRWEVGGQSVAATTQSVTGVLPSGRDVLVAVFVQQAEQTIGRAEEVIRLSDPMVQLYEVNPLRGRSAHPLSERYVLTGREFTIAAVPYFINASAAADLIYEWLINNRRISNPGSDPTILTIENAGGGGQSPVTFRVRNADALEQVAERTVQVQF